MLLREYDKSAVELTDDHEKEKHKYERDLSRPEWRGWDTPGLGDDNPRTWGDRSDDPEYSPARKR